MPLKGFKGGAQTFLEKSCKKICLIEKYTLFLYYKLKERDMKTMVTELVAFVKEDPEEFFGSLACLLSIFGMFYAMIWIGAALGLN